MKLYVGAVYSCVEDMRRSWLRKNFCKGNPMSALVTRYLALWVKHNWRITGKQSKVLSTIIWVKSNYTYT